MKFIKNLLLDYYMTAENQFHPLTNFRKQYCNYFLFKIGHKKYLKIEL